MAEKSARAVGIPQFKETKEYKDFNEKRKIIKKTSKIVSIFFIVTILFFLAGVNNLFPFASIIGKILLYLSLPVIIIFIYINTKFEPTDKEKSLYLLYLLYYDLEKLSTNITDDKLSKVFKEHLNKFDAIWSFQKTLTGFDFQKNIRYFLSELNKEYIDAATYSIYKAKISDLFNYILLENFTGIIQDFSKYKKEKKSNYKKLLELVYNNNFFGFIILIVFSLSYLLLQWLISIMGIKDMGFIPFLLSLAFALLINNKKDKINKLGKEVKKIEIQSGAEIITKTLKEN